MKTCAPMLASAALGIVLAGTVSATEIFDNTPSTCTSANCSSLLIPGTVLNRDDLSLRPWEVQLFALPNECVRLEVAAQQQDFEMVVTAPDGTVFRNDDGGSAACPNCS